MKDSVRWVIKKLRNPLTNLLARARRAFSRDYLGLGLGLNLGMLRPWGPPSASLNGQQDGQTLDTLFSWSSSLGLIHTYLTPLPPQPPHYRPHPLSPLSVAVP